MHIGQGMFNYLFPWRAFRATQLPYATLHDSNWTLEKYIYIALQIFGSPFPVGEAESLHKMVANPEPLHNMACQPRDHS